MSRIVIYRVHTQKLMHANANDNFQVGSQILSRKFTRHNFTWAPKTFELKRNKFRMNTK